MLLIHVLRLDKVREQAVFANGVRDLKVFEVELDLRRRMAWVEEGEC